MKITLEVNGREMTFSEKELIAILEEHFANQEESKEGVWVKVNPESINQDLFKEEREDPLQEMTRQIIIGALDELNSCQSKYGRTFEIMFPEKTWSSKTVKELEKYASDKGDHLANWVEQALEWAQMINDGVSWEEVCNKPDTAKWYRLVMWKDGEVRIVGGSSILKSKSSISKFSESHYFSHNELDQTVPAIVRYK